MSTKLTSVALAAATSVAMNADAMEADLKLTADEVYHNLIRAPYTLDLQSCEISVHLVSHERVLQCLSADPHCPTPVWFRLDDRYYEIDAQVVFSAGTSLATGLDLFNCRREATGDGLPSTAYVLQASNADIPLATNEGRALAYVANDEARVLGARTYYGDAVCDHAVIPSVSPPELPWADVIFASTFTSGTL